MSRPDFRTPRVFLDQSLLEGAEIALSRDQINYLVNVLRLGSQSEVLIFNGRDGEWKSHLAIASRREANLLVGQRIRPQPATANLEYAFAPLKHARLDYMVQKVVEMGATRLSPVITQYTQVSRVNLDRMRANVIEAAEQCGVLSIADVAEPESFQRWLQELAPACSLIFCDEGSDVASPLDALARSEHASLSVLIGPEGGFSEQERSALLMRPGVIRLSLGPRILRADTAGVAALALVQSVLGDWR